MHSTKNIVLTRSDKKSIILDTYYAAEINKQPIVIFCHGYKGFKDWGAWDLMANKVSAAGYCFIKFNFSHNGGTMENPIDFPDLNAFGNNNYSKELEDLNDVINWTQNHFLNNDLIDTSQIYLMGHSRGGGIAIIKAFEDIRVKKLIALASVSDFSTRTYTIGNLKEWKEKGVKYVINGRTKQRMPHFFQFYEDFKANEKRLNIKSAVEQLSIPILIIHGDEDTSIALHEAENLHNWNPKSQLEIIEGANHVFNTKHPWEKTSLSKELNKVAESTIKFLNK
ncbi:MAG: alpha/beta hydrolase fold domain-containing protein [Winogradskyella sp.]|uniref:alpha/beta hydrolase family protein n=1 Tax=Winogradskyella sp. TaxID=1883156 RepID=UPI00179FDD2F|nr:alpha/beta hydrolase fold domain-containing protein [Winogradskyella sp.]